LHAGEHGLLFATRAYDVNELDEAGFFPHVISPLCLSRNIRVDLRGHSCPRIKADPARFYDAADTFLSMRANDMTGSRRKGDCVLATQIVADQQFRIFGR
jgi:hypothetical protein